MCPYKPCENSIFSSFSLFVKIFEEEIQLFEDCVNTARGETLEYLQELLSREPYKHVFSYILDNGNISFWCLGVFFLL